MNFEKDDCKVCEIDLEEIKDEWISLIFLKKIIQSKYVLVSILYYRTIWCVILA